ncbi:MAG: phosphatidylinositol-3-phosphatase [Gaiellaceae bacterium]|nr:phosphatidylinositol-3-phosphatase [Gaiellaceae bacterium]
MTRAVAALALVVAVSSSASAAAAPRPVPNFRHVIVFVFENKESPDVIGSGAAPTFDALGKRYASITNYDGVAHPSLPNYLALVSGSTHGITSDCTSCTVSAPSLADTLAAKRKTWKTYAEGLPSPGWDGATAGRYAKKHNPFLYFTRIKRSERLKRIVPLERFSSDVAQGRLPDFSLVVPDLCHDMHDCSVATGDAWLKQFTKPLLGSRKLARSVIFVVFDEGTTGSGGGGHVAALALGPLVRPGSTFAGRTNHYGLLRTIEDAWGLPRLGRSKTARAITGIWR